MNPYLNRKAIVSKRGQWDYPGQDTIVPTPDGSITMQGVNYPVYGQDETGYGQIMYPNKEYKFPGNMVYEKPMMAVGGITNANPVNPITPTEAEKRAKMLQIYNEELQKAKNKVSSEAFKNKFAYEGKMSGWNESEIEQERNNRIANYENIDYQYDNFNDVFTEQPGARGLIEPDLQYSKMAKIIDPNNPSKGYALSLEKQNKTKAGINPSLLQFENIARSAIQHEIGGHIGDVASPNDKSSLEYYGDNEGTPIYAPVWNHTPFALQTIKENTVPHPYYSMPTEVKAGKRQVENLLENAPIDKVNFGKTWKYGDDVSLEHFKYILNPQQYSDNPNEFKNEESDMMLKSIYGEDRVKKGRDFSEDEINEGYKKFKNLMILAQNQNSMSNNNTNPYGITARNGSMIKRADGSYSQRGLWDNIRENKGSGKKPTEQMLEQEKKIKQQEMGEGGYVVRKTDERKGKTHVVIGPDGTKKYFGDPNMGERDDSKLGKEAFYSRHADNLRDNPYFRAYARATWANGGEVNNPYIKARSGIYIKPENRGKFTAWAQNHDMGVQEAASKVMANKEEYSPSVVKMANFAKNAAGWNKGQDGLEANLPEAPTNMFSDYNPVSDDYTAAMTGMMKARMATDAEFGNTAAKRMTSLYPKTYTFTGDEMFYDEKVDVPAGATGTHYTTGDGNVMFPIIQEGQDGNLFFNRYANPYNKEAMRFETPQDASYFGENYKNIAPMMYNQQMKKGGESDLVPVEVERSERIYDSKGNLLKEIPADAPTHEEGGVKLHLRPGTLVFPKKYYKALDAASGLPEFNKIKEKMLDNAEKAYLRGEPYSSGGKRN